MKIEEGKWYRRRDGEIVGSASYAPFYEHDTNSWKVGRCWYTEEGKWIPGDLANFRDLVEEVPAPKPVESAYGGPIPAPEPQQESPRFRVGDRVRDVTREEHPVGTVRAVLGAKVKIAWDDEEFDERGAIFWPENDFELIDDSAAVGENGVSTTTFGDLDRYPDDNPKTLVGLTKPPLRAIPPVALLHLGGAMADGEAKYGRFNWRDKRVTSSVYYDAMQRHLLAWWDGEDNAPDSQRHHLAHVMACCSILLDASAAGKLNDDRRTDGVAGAVVSAWTKNAT